MKSEIIKHDFKAGLPQEFEILDLKPLVEEHGDMLTTPHRAGFYHIIWFQQGNPTHLVDFKTLEIVPNTLLDHGMEKHRLFMICSELKMAKLWSIGILSRRFLLSKHMAMACFDHRHCL